jgi:undecaprenyl-diphosphatase
MSGVKLRIPDRYAGAIVVTLAMAMGLQSAQGCGLSHIDHRIGYDDTGIWNSDAYRGLVVALSVAQVGGAVWEGAESRFGKTMWQGIDAEIGSGLVAEAGKYIFTRARPDQGNDPCLWFQGSSHYSFPSGEASVAAGLVTPYVLEYGADHPATYALLLVPLYVGVGRLKNQAHWQTDVLAGWAVGGLTGWYAHSRETPVLISILPHGVAVGLHKQF